MTYDDFVGQVQHRAHLASTGEAVRAIRATLESLAERLAGGEAKDLASQLPQEIGYYLLNAPVLKPQRLSLHDFFRLVQMREGHGVELSEAVHHARVVIQLLTEAVSHGEIKDVLSQLPEEWKSLFFAVNPENLVSSELAGKHG